MKASIANKNILCSFLLTLLLLILSSSFSPHAEAAYDGYSVSAWTADGSYGSTLSYYRLYQSASDRMGEPCFYSDSASDVYTNIYTGWDVSITFYRPYLSPTQEQASAFYKYLLREVLPSNHQGYAGWFVSVDSATGYERIFCYLIDGWNLDNSELDFQDLWDRNPWMNGNAAILELEFIGYGDLIRDQWDYIWNTRNCSAAICVQRYLPWGGMTIGLRFMEGTEDTPVRKYCYHENNQY